MDDTEIEEGEACYYKENSRIDPDIALSYIDEKLQNVLGHFQKDFEGGVVSAENLGTKFGGYGSFLPTHQRCPSIWSRPKNLTEVQNFSSPESPNVLPVESAPKASAAQSTRLGAAPRSLLSLNTAMATSAGLCEKKGSRLSFDQGKKFEEPVMNKQASSSDQRTLKVRLRINSDKTAKNKAAIYSGFGLNTTPSSSMGNSEDSSGIPSQCAGTMEESPSNILQIMTSFPVPGGSPLSPLLESLLCLKIKENRSQTSNSKAIKKVTKGKKKRAVEKKENTVISDGEIGTDLGDRNFTSMKSEVDVKVENMEGETLSKGLSLFRDKDPNPQSRKVRNIVDNKKGADMAARVCKEEERNVSGDKLDVSKSRMRDMSSLVIAREESLESISDHNGGNFEKRDILSSSMENIPGSRSKNYCKDESVEVTRNVQSRRIENNTMSKADSAVSNCSRDVAQVVVGHEKEELKLPHGVEKSSSKGKKKSTRSQNSVDLASEAEGSLISGSYERPKETKKSGKMRNLKSQDDNINMHSEATREQVTKHIDYSPERPSTYEASKSSRRFVEKKQGSSLHKSREISIQKDINAQLIPNSSLIESANHGVASVLEPTPVSLIPEHWVQCDRCDKWRLLPFGILPEHLPDNWVCRMLTWLPGMNRCDISQKATTDALNSLYPPVPGASSAEGLDLDMENHNSRRMQPKSKETHYVANNGGSVLASGSVKSFQQDVVKRRSLNDMNQKLSVENSHKHKEKHEERGDPKEKKLKSKRAADHDEYVTPKRSRVDVASGAVKIRKKVPSSSIPEGESQQLGSSETKTYAEREISLKKRKLKDWQESQNCPGASKDDVDHLNERKDFIKEETSDNEFRKFKKPAMSNLDENSRIIGKPTKLNNPVHGREEPVSIENGQQVRKQKTKGSACDNMEKLNKDWGPEQFSRAATSSSSKVSDSLKSRSYFQEVKGSPVESVSSSPIRTSNLENIPTKRDNLRKKASKNSHIPKVDFAKKSLNMEGNSEIKSGTVRRVKVAGISHSESPAIDFRDNSKGQKLGGKSRIRGESPDKYRSVDFVKNDSENLKSTRLGDLQPPKKNLNNDYALSREKSKNVSSLLPKGKDGSPGSNPERLKVSIRSSEMLANPKGSLTDGVHTGPKHIDPRDLKCRIKLVRDNKLTREATQQDLIQGLDDGVARRSDLTQVESTGGSCSQVVSNHVANKDSPAQIPPSIHKGNVLVPPDSFCSGDSSKVPKQNHNEPSPLTNDASSQSATVFEQAENLKNWGDRLKGSGFLIEANETHFQAVSLFLQAASLRESCNYSSNKHGEKSPMQIYSSTAKLCELCADEYEKRDELAAAALAYKYVYVAYMRVVYCKSSTINRDRHDLQTSLQIVSQGESPSSSASDVDSLNNQVMVDKAGFSKTVGNYGGNHIIVARNRPNFARLLDFTKDVNSAMEASDKSQKAFTAAILKGAQSKEGIDSVKRVIDFSFQDVDELIRLVRVAYDSISRQGFKGNTD